MSVCVGRRSRGKYNSEYLQPLVKLGGCSFMVWGFISASGVGNPIKIAEIINAEKPGCVEK